MGLEAPLQLHTVPAVVQADPLPRRQASQCCFDDRKRDAKVREGPTVRPANLLQERKSRTKLRLKTRTQVHTYGFRHQVQASAFLRASQTGLIKRARGQNTEVSASVRSDGYLPPRRLAMVHAVRARGGERALAFWFLVLNEVWPTTKVACATPVGFRNNAHHTRCGRASAGARKRSAQ